jgi:hypothetical protein
MLIGGGGGGEEKSKRRIGTVPLGNLVPLVLWGPLGLVRPILEGPGGRPLEALTLPGRPLFRCPAILNSTI